MSSRSDALSRIAGPWDVLVVGGGITGAGIALAAARAGLQTLLVEKHDFAWGTSSRSGKLVHGGLRYLKQGKLLLTRESVRARERLLRESAGLVEELTFLLPVYRGDRPGRRVYAAGLWLYDLLAGRAAHRWHEAGEFLMLAPRIARNGLVGGFQYRDAKADDARLVLRVLREAERAGATVVNYLGVETLLRDAGMVAGVGLLDEITGRTFEARARAVVNATGAWSDVLRGQVGRPPRLRPLRGSHLVFPEWRLPLAFAVGFLHPVDRRPLYALPWEGATLVGTTDVEHHGLSGEDEPGITAGELDYLMEALNALFPAVDLRPSDAVATFSGVRPVVGTGQKDPSRESRDSVLWEESGLITVTGGKLTTFHATARAALGLVRRRLGRPSSGRAGPAFDPFPPDALAGARVRPEDGLRLRARYGVEAPAVVDAARDHELSRIPGLSALWAELRWAARAEWVVHLDDLLLRRVRLGLLSPGGGVARMPFVREICRTELGWDEARWEAELRRYLEVWERRYSVPGDRPPPR